MAKQLAFTEEARKKLKTGIDTMASAVKTTLGPKGRNVALDNFEGPARFRHLRRFHFLTHALGWRFWL